MIKPQMLTAREAVEFLGVDRSYFESAVKRGLLPREAVTLTQSQGGGTIRLWRASDLESIKPMTMIEALAPLNKLIREERRGRG